MKTYISNELFVASSSPIIEKYMLGLYRTGEIVDYFLVNPVIKKYFFGKKIIGYVEAISKEPICDTFYIYNSFGVIDVFQVDSISKSLDVGDVDWNVNCYIKADKLLKKETIDKYFKQSKEEIVEQINYVRGYCKEFAKNKKILVNKEIK